MESIREAPRVNNKRETNGIGSERKLNFGGIFKTNMRRIKGMKAKSRFMNWVITVEKIRSILGKGTFLSKLAFDIREKEERFVEVEKKFQNIIPESR